MSRQTKIEGAIKVTSQIIDIAIEALIKHPPKQLDNSSFTSIVKWYKQQKIEIFQLEAKFQTIANFKNIQKEILTYFQEDTGETVNHFWQLIKENDIPIQRIGVIEKVLKKNKISNQFEYDTIIDRIVVAQQEGSITKAQSAILSDLIGKFEMKNKK